jgi:Icc-related predicted phosphoesterase
MRLYVVSDLHIEFHDFDPPDVDADLIVLAGDVGEGTAGVEWAAEHFPGLPVIYVPGNHEFYERDIGTVDQLKAAAPSNVHVLNNDVFEHGGIRFLGTTLWTDFKFNGEAEAGHAQQKARIYIRDFKSIRNGQRHFTPDDSAHLHRNSVHWLVTELERELAGPTVVVTHHLPAAMSVSKRYSGDPLNPAFASHLEGIIEKFQPALWIHGYTHAPCDYELFGTRVVCNPRGYPGEKHQPVFRPDLVVTV